MALGVLHGVGWGDGSGTSKRWSRPGGHESLAVSLEVEYLGPIFFKTGSYSVTLGDLGFDISTRLASLHVLFSSWLV